jgi:hypothetical protein
MFTFEIIIFALASIASFGFFGVSVYRFRNHKIRYPLGDDKCGSIIGFRGYRFVVLFWFLSICFLIVLFAYLIFFSPFA